MTVTTTYEKVAGAPLEVAVWVITQLKNPVAVGAPLAGGVRQGLRLCVPIGRMPAGLHVADGLAVAREGSPAKPQDRDARRHAGLGGCNRVPPDRFRLGVRGEIPG